MKKYYRGLEYEVVRFDEEDIITASNETEPCAPDEQVCKCLGDDGCNCIGVEK